MDHKKIKVLVFVALAGAAIALFLPYIFSSLLSKPKLSESHKLVHHDFKKIICPLHAEVHRQYKNHRSLYNLIDVDYQANDDAIIKGYWKTLQALGSDDEKPPSKPGENPPMTDLERKRNTLTEVALFLQNEEYKRLYDQEILTEAKMADPYMREESIDSATDMRTYARENEKMQKTQKDVDQKLAKYCEGYNYR